MTRSLQFKNTIGCARTTKYEKFYGLRRVPVSARVKRRLLAKLNKKS